MANLVFKDKKAKKPMARHELAKAFGPAMGELYDMSRLEGNHCDCNGNGEFVLLPLNSKAVREGGKRYMKCRKCGLHSHL